MQAVVLNFISLRFDVTMMRCHITAMCQFGGFHRPLTAAAVSGDDMTTPSAMCVALLECGDLLCQAGTAACVLPFRRLNLRVPFLEIASGSKISSIRHLAQLTRTFTTNLANWIATGTQIIKTSIWQVLLQDVSDTQTQSPNGLHFQTLIQHLWVCNDT